ncbi:phytoene desaturase family protein [Pseudooceanicola atlanticus]|uniref:Pyridine nucleotide-disulfide oxidoreductase domain-containing protein 2 n=1 Tax=Pseudooceanicola atlanticus TaxID=1461694 RepID=A0A0A0EHE0_9RHOB|nr:NAD(P)/FAD-dependent oxidoreductase [Pseudooceanicola atlanticus]KGM49804.1 dehydrogenase [Pseudooceanicola atlanticus]
MGGQVVIIGSGINGLVAGAELAAGGKSVLILERGPTPGGAVRTEELTLPGYRHDVAAMNLSMFAGSAFMAAHGEEMGKHGFELVPIQRPFAQALTPGDYVGISTDVEETLATFASDADKAAWRQLMADFPERVAGVGGLLGTPMRRGPLAKFLWSTWRRLGTAGTLELAQFLMTSPRDWLTGTFEDERLIAALSSWGMHLDFAPDVAGGAIFPYLEAMAGQAMGMVIGKGGADTVTNALVAMIEVHGGRIECNTEVTAIRHAGGKVTGVEAGGRTINSDTVLAGLAPKHLARLMGPSGNARFDKGLTTFRHAPGTMMLHLAVDGPVPWKAEALGQFAYVHIGSSIDTAAQTYAQAKAGLLPATPVLVVGQPSVFDPSRAPEGKQTLWVQVRVVPAEIRGDAAGQIDATDWDAVKPAMTERVLDLIEAQAPGIRDRILGQHAVSPLDLEAENPNLVGGDQLCGSHHMSQNFLFRPVRGFADGTTPVKGLHMIGAACWPGAGTGAGSGHFTAQALS